MIHCECTSIDIYRENFIKTTRTQTKTSTNCSQDLGNILKESRWNETSIVLFIFSINSPNSSHFVGRFRRKSFTNRLGKCNLFRMPTIIHRGTFNVHQLPLLANGTSGSTHRCIAPHAKHQEGSLYLRRDSNPGSGSSYLQAILAAPIQCTLLLRFNIIILVQGILWTRSSAILRCCRKKKGKCVK